MFKSSSVVSWLFRSHIIVFKSVHWTLNKLLYLYDQKKLSDIIWANEDGCSRDIQFNSVLTYTCMLHCFPCRRNKIYNGEKKLLFVGDNYLPNMFESISLLLTSAITAIKQPIYHGTPVLAMNKSPQHGTLLPKQLGVSLPCFTASGMTCYIHVLVCSCFWKVRYHVQKRLWDLYSSEAAPPKVMSKINKCFAIFTYQLLMPCSTTQTLEFLPFKCPAVFRK